MGDVMGIKQNVKQTGLQGDLIPAGTGTAIHLPRGACVVVVAVEGPQVADMWALNYFDSTEFLSTEHTRSCNDRLTPRVGDAFFTNLCREILTVVEDTSPGTHDLLLSACSPARLA